MLVKVLQLQFTKIKNNKVTFLLLVALAGMVAWFGNKHDAGHGYAGLIQAAAYLFAMWLCAYCIDLFTAIKPAKGDFTVRRPVPEFLITFLCILLGIVFISIRFTGKIPWDHRSNAVRLPVVAGIMLFTFPIALAVIMLLLGYRRKDFGIRLQGFLPGIAVLAITAITAHLVAPGAFTLPAILAESGSIGAALIEGFITAALSEEFLRVIMQTRFAALLRNTGAGWLIASLLWGLTHGPQWYNENKDITETILSCLRIVPLGLMWGYLTLRTRSILPSVLVHGMNVWGLQNF